MMARPTWKGHISFGLVNIPVTLYTGEKKADLSFNLIDSRNMARVRYERVNEETGEEVPWGDIVKGFEFEEGNYVVLDDEDFKRAAPEATKSIDIEAFVDREAIDPVYFEKPYFLVPDKKGEKGYVLLRETLQKQNKAGIARVVIRTREHLAALMVEGDALVLMLLRFQQELRDPAEFDLPKGSLKEYKISAKELDLAETLVEAMSGEWKPEQYEDKYRAELMEWIEKKIRAGETAEPAVPEEEVEEEAEPVDIMALLQMSVQQTGNGR
jgi:DNA end-binding protein Ku